MGTTEWYTDVSGSDSSRTTAWRSVYTSTLLPSLHVLCVCVCVCVCVRARQGDMFIQVVFASACVVGKLLCLRVFVHLCVSMWSSVNGISVAFCVFYLTTCSGGLNVCVCLQEERDRQGALAAQASPAVSLPPLAPSALAEVVTRRQTAKWQNATPRATRNIASQAQAPSVGEKPA